MKDKLLYGTIGLLVGVVVMQGTMPATRATVVTTPVGNVVALMGDWVVGVDGNMWYWNQQYGWENRGPLPFPLEQLQFITKGSWGTSLVDKSGNYWEDDSTTPPGVFVNHGQPPIGPVANDQSTWGKVKAQFKGNGK